MTDETKGGAQRAHSLRPRCVREVDPETATHIYLSKFHVEDLQILRATIQNLVAQGTWHWRLVYHWNS
jgi:hypothetical protein